MSPALLASLPDVRMYTSPSGYLVLEPVTSAGRKELETWPTFDGDSLMLDQDRGKGVARELELNGLLVHQGVTTDSQAVDA